MFGHISQGCNNDGVGGTTTIHSIHASTMPEGRKATYAEFIANIRPQKEEIHRVCLTAGNNLIQYPWTIRTPTVNTTTTKLLLKSVVSTPGANFTTSDINDFYLNILKEKYEYMRIHINMTPKDIINTYNLLLLEKKRLRPFRYPQGNVRTTPIRQDHRRTTCKEPRHVWILP